MAKRFEIKFISAESAKKFVDVFMNEEEHRSVINFIDIKANVVYLLFKPEYADLALMEIYCNPVGDDIQNVEEF